MARTRFNRKLKRRQLANTSSEGQDELWTLDKRAIGKSPKSSKRKLRRTRKQNPSLTSHHENRKKGAVAAERSSSSATTVRWLAVEETKSQPTVLTVDSSDEDEQDDECKIEFFGTGRSPHQKPKRPAVADPVVINMLKASKNDIRRRASTNSSTGSSTGSPTKVVAIDQSIKTTVKEVQHELGEGPWAVDFADSLKLLPDKLRRTHEARYFLPVHCQLCKGIDHVTDRCPDQEKPENVVCYLCGDRDHWASKCQYKFCSLCNTVGHFSSHCKNISKVRGQFCKRCNQRGHVVAICPESWRQLHSTTSTPSKKGSTPVKERSATDTRPLSCFVCAQSGHIAQQCTAPHALMHDLGVLNKSVTRYDNWQLIESAAASLEKQRATDSSSGAEKDVRIVTDAIDECLRGRSKETIMSQLDIDSMRDLSQLLLRKSIRSRVAVVLRSADRQQLLDRFCLTSSLFAKYAHSAFGKRQAGLTKKLFHNRLVNFKWRLWTDLFDRMEAAISAAQATLSPNKLTAEVSTPVKSTIARVVQEAAAASTEVVKPSATSTSAELTPIITTDLGAVETSATKWEAHRDLAAQLKESLRAYGQSMGASGELLSEMVHRCNLLFCRSAELSLRLLPIFASEDQTRLVDRICKAMYGMADLMHSHQLQNIGCCTAKKRCARMRRLRKLRLFRGENTKSKNQLELIQDQQLIEEVKCGLGRLEKAVVSGKRLDANACEQQQKTANKKQKKKKGETKKGEKEEEKKLATSVIGTFKQPRVKQTLTVIAKTAARYTAELRRRALQPDYSGWHEYVEQVEAPGGYLRGTDWPSSAHNPKSTLAGYGVSQPNLASSRPSLTVEQRQTTTLKRSIKSHNFDDVQSGESSSSAAKRSRLQRYNLRYQ